MSQEDQKLALFIDIDNVIIGLRESGHPKFDVKLLISRLLDKGKIVIKKAYADWSRYAEYKRAFHESAFELIDIPQHKMTGKNSADIRMVVDAMDLASNKEHITTFVIGSGDSDFSPLVSKLKENNKTVLGFGVKGSTSELLIENCDEFIYYEDLVREQVKVPAFAGAAGEEPRGLRAPHRLDAGAQAREQGSPLGLDGQADDAAQEPELLGVVLRLPRLLRAPRVGPEAEGHHAEARRQERLVHHHRLRAGDGRLTR